MSTIKSDHLIKLMAYFYDQFNHKINDQSIGGFKIDVYFGAGGKALF